MIPTSIVLVGPTHGVPGGNVPAFRMATGKLGAAGWSVSSPVTDETVGGLTVLERSIRDVLTYDAVALLPGWARDVDARAIALVAQRLERPMFQFFTHRPSLLEPLDGVNVLTRVEALP